MWAHPTVLELLELQYEFREPFIVESTKIATKLGWCDGSFAEYASAPEDQLARKPATLSFEQAAAVPISGFAALQGLRDVGEVQAGQRILVIGRPAGWGRSRSSWPRRSVTGVASTTQVDLVRSIGADDVIDNTREDVTDGVRRWDLILDTAGRRSLSQLRRALTPKGTLIIVGGEGAGRWMGGFDRQLRAPVLSRFVGHRLRMLASTERPEDLQTLRELLEAGTLTPRVGRTYTRHVTAGPAVSLTVPGPGMAARGGRVCASSCCAAR